MTDQMSPDVTSDDKLWAALSYVFAPVVGIIVLLMEDKKDRPFIKFHAVQSIAISIVLLIVVPIIAVVTLGCGSVLYLVMFWWAYKAYQGEEFTIPVITDFIKNQGWI
jgi:uncharacterized membrane protein